VLLVHREAFAVGVEADEHELPAPVHDHIVIAVSLVLDAVPRVRALIGLDADHRVPDTPAMVDEPPLRAIAGVGSFNAFIVTKILEVFVNEGLCLCLFEAVCLRAWIVWEKKFEARGAKVIVIRVTHARVWPCDAVRTPETSAVRDTLVGLTLSTLAAALNDAALATAVLDALVRITSSTLAAALNDAALATAVLDALVRITLSTLAAALNNAALAAAVLDALVRIISSTLAAALNDAALASTVPLALVGLTSSTLATALDDATLAATVCLALSSAAYSKFFTAFNNAYFSIPVFYAFERTDVHPIRFTKHTKNFIQLPFLTPR